MKRWLLITLVALFCLCWIWGHADYILPTATQVIESEAFMNNTSLLAVVFPDGLQRIESRAFAGCRLLRVSLPASILYIAEDAFDGNDGMLVVADQGSNPFVWACSNGFGAAGFYSDKHYTRVGQDTVISWQMSVPAQQGVSYGLDLDGETLFQNQATDGPGCAYYEYTLSVTSELVGDHRLLLWMTDTNGDKTVMDAAMITVQPGADEPTVNVDNYDGGSRYLELGSSWTYSCWANGEGSSIEEIRAGVCDSQDRYISLTVEGDTWDDYFSGSFTIDTDDLPGAGVYLVLAEVSTQDQRSSSYSFPIVVGEPWVNLTVEATGTDTYHASWNEVPFVSYYCLAAYQGQYTSYSDMSDVDYYTRCVANSTSVDIRTDTDTAYTFVLWIIVGDTWCHAGPVVPAEPIPASDAPQSLSYTVDLDGKITFSWDPVTGAAGYRVYASTSGEWHSSTTPSAPDLITGNSCTSDDMLTWVQPGSTFHFWVCAEMDNGPSRRAHVTVDWDAEAWIPQRVTTEAQSSDCYVVSWKPIDSAIGYRVYYSTSNQVTKDCEYIEVDAYSNYILNYVYPGEQRWYAVSALYQGGESELSGVTTDQPKPLLPLPTSVVCHGVSEYGYLQLSWTPVPYAEYYRIYYSSQPIFPVQGWRYWTASSPCIDMYIDDAFGYGDTVFLWVTAVSDDDDPGEPSECISFLVQPRTLAAGIWHGLDWILKSDGTLTISGSGEMADLSDSEYENGTGWQSYNYKINSVVIEEGITSIGRYAFSNCYYLTDVSVPDSVTRIEDYAFRGCENLSSIALPNSLTSIGDYAFRDCCNLMKVTGPNGIANVGDGVFYNCDSLPEDENGFVIVCGILCSFRGEAVDVTIPDSVSTIENSAFRYNSSLVNITIPYGVTRIGNNAFEYCNSLEDVTLPDSITSIGDHAFANCDSLTDIAIPDSLTSIAPYVFYDCGSLNSVIIPEHVTSIGDHAFCYCSNLSDLTIGDSVTSIGDYAFANCDGLTGITIPDGLTSISPYVFYDCDGLTNVTIPEHVTSIGDHAFYYCSNLSNITIPDGVTSIGSYAFYRCRMTGLTIPGSVTSVGDYAFYYCSNLSSLTISDGVTAIGSHAFYRCKMTELTIPDSVTSIGSHAFDSCSNLTELKMPESADSMGEAAFSGCSKLKTITIPDGITTIESDTFGNCSQLVSVTIPDSVTIIDDGAFSNCGSLTRVNYKGSEEDWVDIQIGSNNDSILGASFLYNYGPWTIIDSGTDGSITWSLNVGGTLTISGNGPMNNYSSHDVSGTYGTTAPWGTSVVNIVIADGVTSVGNYAFRGCSNLTNVTIPDSVTTIGRNAFTYCTNLPRIVVPDSVITIDVYAFAACSSLTSFSIPDSVDYISDATFRQCSSLANIVIPNTVSGIGARAFEGCSSLTSITIPDSVTDIGEYAFYQCSALDSISLPEDIYVINQYTFYECTNLSNVVFPEYLETIGSRAFMRCSSLTIINLPPYLDSINECAFLGCTSLTGIDLPDTLSHLGTGAFTGCSSLSHFGYPINIIKVDGAILNGCSSLTEVTIPEGVYKVMDYFIWDAGNVQTIYFPSSIEEIGKYSFAGDNAFTSIILPETIEKIDEYAFYQCTSLTEIQFSSVLDRIEGSAFEECTGLTSVDLPESLAYLGYKAFRNCTTLSHFGYPVGIREVGGTFLSGCTSLQEITVPEGVTVLMEYFVCNQGTVTTINLPSTLEKIGKYAFYGESNVFTQINIPEGVTQIDEQAFAHNTSLQSINIPGSVQTIGLKAFDACSALRTITFHDGLNSIGILAFRNCTALRSVTLPNSVTVIGSGAFQNCSAMSSFTPSAGWVSVAVPGTLSNLAYEILPGRIFEGCTKLVRVTVPEGTTSIPSYAYSYAPNLTTVVLPSTVNSIGKGAFMEATALRTINYPDGLTYIGYGAFKNCAALKSCALPDSVDTIGSEAFYNCSALTSMHFPKNWTTVVSPALGDSWGVNLFGTGNIFGNDYRITTVEIPDGAVRIPAYAFQNCTGLRTVTVPSSVTDIGNQAFDNCTALPKVYISPSVTSLGSNVFKNCSILTVWCEYGSTVLQYCMDNGVDYYYLTPTGINNPSGTLYKGDGYGLRGYAHASVEMMEITATIWDSTKVNVLQQITAIPEELDYAISGKINSNLHFERLPLGSYCYTLIAKTALSEEQWADTSFTIVPPPLRIFIQNLSLPSGLIRAGESTSISGTIISNYSITSVTIRIIDNADGTIARTFNATPNQLEYALAAANDSLNLSALPYSNYSIQIIAMSNGETKILCSSDFDPVNYTGSIDDEMISALIAYAADGDHRDVFTKTYAEQVIDDLSWVEYSIVIVDSIANLDIFKTALKKLFTSSGDQSDELIDLYKTEILTLLDDGAYDGATPIQSLKSDWKTILNSIKDGTSVYKELVKNDKMKFGIDICKSIVKGLKKGLDYGEDIEEGINTLGACMSNAEEKLIILENLKQSAEFAGIPEFETAVDIVTEEYTCWVNASLQELEDVFIDVFIDFSSEKLGDAVDMLYEFSHDGAKSSLSSFGKFQLGLKIGQRITGLDEEAQKFKSFFIQYNILNGGIKEYQAAFDIVHNGDTSTDAINRLYIAGNTIKSEWIRLHKTICSLPRYAYTIGNAALDYWDANLRNTMPFVSTVSLGD